MHPPLKRENGPRTTREISKDIKKEGLLAEMVPLTWKPFVRMLRLTSGVLLTFWPVLWGLTLVATKVKLPVKEYRIQVVWYFFDAVVGHTVGGIWNDMCDRDIDRGIERTKGRPLASGEVSLTTARIAMLSLSVLWISSIWRLNPAAFAALMIALFFMSLVYPFMKRVTNWPQAWLGVTVNMGIIVGWLHYQKPDYPVLLAFMVSAFCWMIVADGWNGYMDMKEDTAAGVKSVTQVFGENPKPAISLFALASVAFLAVVGRLSGLHSWFYVLSVGGAACHFAWQIYATDINRPETCYAAFHSNGTQFGYVVWSGLLISYLKSVGIV